MTKLPRQSYISPADRALPRDAARTDDGRRARRGGRMMEAMADMERERNEARAEVKR